MNHSLIPLLKFHPEQPWPHREKEGYWGAKWDEGSGDRAHQSRPCQPRVSLRNDSPPLSFLPSLPSSLHSPAGGLGTTNSLFTTEKNLHAQNDQSWRGYQSAGVWRWWLTPSPLFSLWPNAGKGWGLVLDCSPLFSPTPKSPHLGICWTSCTETTACAGTDWVLGSTQLSMHGRQWKESSISFQPTQLHNLHNYYWK